MAVKKKPIKKGKKLTPKALGTGLASRAAKGMLQEEARRQCIMDGGRWVKGKCVY